MSRSRSAQLDVELAPQRAAADLDVHESIAAAAVACLFAKQCCSDGAERARSVADLALLHGVREPELIAAVRRLRSRATDELVARGLLDAPRGRARIAAPPTVTSYAATG